MNAVSELVAERVRTGSMPGSRNDGAKLGLVIEGGGMRGVISGAMTAALQNLGMADAFDCVVGSSAGAMAGAFFVAGNAPAGATVYYEHINNKNFIDPRRIISGRPIMDLDFLVFEVFQNSVPLNYARILESKLELKVLATAVATGSKAVLADFQSEDEIASALAASSCNPLIGGPPRIFRGEEYWDAALSESIPIKTAQDAGCTHFVVLRTRQESVLRSPTGWIERSIARRVIGRASIPAFSTYIRKDQAYVDEIALISKLEDCSMSIFPSGTIAISQVETDRNNLIAAAVDGYRAVLLAFGYDPEYIGATIAHF